MNGYIIYSAKGGVSLLEFESFYVYIVIMIILLYNILNNKNTIGITLAALVTYGWTSLLVYSMFQKITQIQMNLGVSFYIYLSSAIFLIISLFIGKDEKQNTDINNTLGENISFDKDNFIFVNYISGLKDLPVNPSILLVNNTPNKTIDLIYNIKGEHIANIISFPVANIQKFNYSMEVRVSEMKKEVEENTTRSMLLSTAVFGGHPITQILAVGAFNSFFDSISNNYDKVNLDTVYQITLDVIVEDKVQNYLFFLDVEPKEFIDLVKKN